MLAAAWLALPARADNIGSVSASAGTVVRVPASGRAELLAAGSSLRAGDVIQTQANSDAELRYGDGTVVRLASGTRFTVPEYSFEAQRAGDDRFVARLLAGAMRIVTGAIAKRQPERARFQVGTATIGIRGTDFAVRMCEDECELADAATVARAGQPEFAGRLGGSGGSVVAMDSAGRVRRLAVSAPVNAGDIVAAATGVAVLVMRDQTRVSLDPGTALAIREFRYDEDAPGKARVQLALLAGRVQVATGQLAKTHPERFRFFVGDLPVRVHGTIFGAAKAAASNAANSAGSAAQNAGSSAQNTADQAADAARNAANEGAEATRNAADQAGRDGAGSAVETAIGGGREVLTGGPSVLVENILDNTRVAASRGKEVTKRWVGGTVVDLADSAAETVATGVTETVHGGPQVFVKGAINITRAGLSGASDRALDAGMAGLDSAGQTASKGAGSAAASVADAARRASGKGSDAAADAVRAASEGARETGRNLADVVKQAEQAMTSAGNALVAAMSPLLAEMASLTEELRLAPPADRPSAEAASRRVAALNERFAAALASQRNATGGGQSEATQREAWVRTAALMVLEMDFLAATGALIDPAMTAAAYNIVTFSPNYLAINTIAASALRDPDLLRGMGAVGMSAADLERLRGITAVPRITACTDALTLLVNETGPYFRAEGNAALAAMQSRIAGDSPQAQAGSAGGGSSGGGATGGSRGSGTAVDVREGAVTVGSGNAAIRLGSGEMAADDGGRIAKSDGAIGFVAPDPGRVMVADLGGFFGQPVAAAGKQAAAGVYVSVNDGAVALAQGGKEVLIARGEAAMAPVDGGPPVKVRNGVRVTGGAGLAAVIPGAASDVPVCEGGATARAGTAPVATAAGIDLARLRPNLAIDAKLDAKVIDPTNMRGVGSNVGGAEGGGNSGLGGNRFGQGFGGNTAFEDAAKGAGGKIGRGGLDGLQSNRVVTGRHGDTFAGNALNEGVDARNFGGGGKNAQVSSGMSVNAAEKRGVGFVWGASDIAQALLLEGGTPTGHTEKDLAELKYAQGAGTDGYAATKGMSADKRLAYWTQQRDKQLLGGSGRPREDDNPSAGGSGAPIYLGAGQFGNEIRGVGRAVGAKVGAAGGSGDGRTDQQGGGGSTGGVAMQRGEQLGAAQERASPGPINWDAALQINEVVNPGRQ